MIETEFQKGEKKRPVLLPPTNRSERRS